MKYLIPLIACAFFFTSCRSYQCITVKNNKVEPTAGGDFIFENDSVLISYNFKGENFPVNIRFMNKMDKAVMIDWRNSSLIINERPYPLKPLSAVTTGTAETRASTFAATPTYNTAFRAETLLPEGTEMVPPKTFITHRFPSVANKFLELPAGHQTGFVPVRFTGVNGGTYKGEEASFTEESTPLAFRCFLTGFVVADSGMRPVMYDHAFYISSLMQTKRDPVMKMDWNQAYVRKGTSVGEVVLGTVVGTVLVVYAIGKANADEKNAEKNR